MTHSAFTAAVVAGGVGRRMGEDKRLMPVAGVPLLLRVVRVVQPLARQTLVVISPARPLPAGLLDGLEVEVATDRLAEGGPLAGIEAALHAARHGLVLVVGGDHPWLQPAVLRLLLAEAVSRPELGAVALASARGPEPLLAVYRRSALPAVTGLLDAGERRTGRLLEEVRSGLLTEGRWLPADPGRRTLVNLNTPADRDTHGTGPMTY